MVDPTPQAGTDDDHVDAVFAIEGTLSELHVALGTENLLKRVSQHYKSHAVLTGAGAVVGDLFGQAANAASLAMYDGEDTQNFACLIDGQVMCGQFGGAEWLKQGNRIKAVVSKQGDVLYARAIMDEQQELLWIGHPWGSKAEAAANWTLALWCFLFGMFGMATMYLIAEGAGSWSFWEMILTIGLIGGALCIVVALWSNRDMQGLASPSTKAFQLLGFSEPERVNLNRYRVSVVAGKDHRRDRSPRTPVLDMGEFQTRDVYCYQRAIQDGKVALAAPVGGGRAP